MAKQQSLPRNSRLEALGAPLDASLRALCSLAEVLVFVMMGSIALSAALRFIVGRDIPGVIELNEALVVAVAFLPLAMTQRNGAHIRAEFLSTHFHGRKQVALNLLELAAGIAFFGVITWYSGKEAYASFLIREVRPMYMFPIWPARIVLALGTFALCMAFLRDAVRLGRTLR